MTMKGIDEKYIDVLQQFGFHLYTTETGYKLCYNPIGGTFSANFNDENFVENLINFAETFDPSTYASVEIEGPCSIKELAETVKSLEKIQLLLLKVALAFVKIDKESMVKRCELCCSQALFYKLSQLECLLLRASAKKNRESSDIQDGSCF